MQGNTKAYLQPNPTARTKLAVQTSYQKARGQAKSAKYPQPEFNLAEVNLHRKKLESRRLDYDYKK